MTLSSELLHGMIPNKHQERTTFRRMTLNQTTRSRTECHVLLLCSAFFHRLHNILPNVVRKKVVAPSQGLLTQHSFYSSKKNYGKKLLNV
jgi:hypothetical protein